MGLLIDKTELETIIQNPLTRELGERDLLKMLNEKNDTPCANNVRFKMIMDVIFYK